MLTSNQIKNLIKTLKNDEIVIIPTDTIYGFSALNSSKNQLRINQLKKAPDQKPLITLISNHQQLSELVNPQKLIKFNDLLNQGITLIVPNRHNEKQTLAIRLIKNPNLVKVINESGPLWSTSVNFYGQENLQNISQIKAQFPKIPIFVSTEQALEKKPSRIYNTLTNKWLR